VGEGVREKEGVGVGEGSTQKSHSMPVNIEFAQKHHLGWVYGVRARAGCVCVRCGRKRSAPPFVCNFGGRTRGCCARQTHPSAPVRGPLPGLAQRRAAPKGGVPGGSPRPAAFHISLTSA